MIREAAVRRSSPALLVAIVFAATTGCSGSAPGDLDQVRSAALLKDAMPDVPSETQSRPIAVVEKAPPEETTSPATEVLDESPASNAPGSETSKQVSTAVEATEFAAAPQSLSRSGSTSGGKDSEWASWLGPDGNGISRETGLITEFAEEGPTILWRASLGTGYSGLTVAGGRLFTLFGQEGREHVGCFDAPTGKPLWKVDTDEDFAEGRAPGPRSTPCVDGKRVYALGASGQLMCLETATGDAAWKFNMVEKFDFRLHEEGLSASPLIDGKRLVIMAGRSVYALDKSSGELVWKALDESMNHSSPVLRTINGARQLVVLTGRNLVGLVPDTGREIWRHPQEGVNIATPVVGPDNQIFAGAAYGYGCQLLRVSGDSTEEVFKNSVLAPHTATPVLYDGHLYGFHDRPGIFKCVEFATGKEKWNTRETVKGNLIIADGQIILINEEGQVMLAPATPDGFEPTGRARVLRGGLCYTGPSLVQGRLYIRSDKELVCIQLKQ